MNRPLGITILSILAILGGLYYIFIGGFASLLGMSHTFMEESKLNEAGTAYHFLTWIILILGILYLLYGIGLWRMKKWAWNLAVFSTVIGIIYGIYTVASGTSAALSAGSIIGTIISIVILLYLLSKKVKSHFHN